MKQSLNTFYLRQKPLNAPRPETWKNYSQLIKRYRMQKKKNQEATPKKEANGTEMQDHIHQTLNYS